MSRKVAREVIMQFVYQMEVNNDYTIEGIENYLEVEELNNDDIEFIKSSISILLDKKDDIDNKIDTHLQGWKRERIPKVDLSILRVAINEIDNIKDVPSSVSINEAVDMAKRFSTDDSFKFINGLLGTYYRSLGE